MHLLAGVLLGEELNLHQQLDCTEVWLAQEGKDECLILLQYFYLSK